MENPTKKTSSYSTKNFAASRLNSLTHGASSRSLFIKDENPADYVALLDGTFEQYQPASDHDAGIVARCVHDQWVLIRRERAADNAEAALFERQPDTAAWTKDDLGGLSLFARYKTEAARAYDRSLHCLKTIKKLHSDEERWKFYLLSQKEKLAIHIERFEIYKKKQNERMAKEEEDLDPLTDPPPPPPAEHSVGQTLFIGTEKGKTVIDETTPSNDDLRKILTPDHKVSRTYNFIGSVPAEYQHLVTSEAYTFGKSTCIHKTYTFEEWSSQVASEPRP
jgi:hypothetical protein